MESIKEMSEKLYPTNKYNINLSDVHRKEGFEKGANYVLKEIESLMKDVSNEYPRFQQGTIIHGRLIKLLEQLKK